MSIKRAMSSADCIKFEKKIFQLIGENRIEQYRDIYPLILLTVFYTQMCSSLNQTYEGIIQGDFINFKQTSFLRAKIKEMVFCVVYALLRMTHFSKGTSFKKNAKVCFSNTLLNSPRYLSIRKEYNETYGYQAIVAVSDAVLPGSEKLKTRIVHSLRSDRETGEIIFAGKETIAGKKLRKYLYEWCGLLLKCKNDLPVCEHDIDFLLKELSAEYSRRKKIVTRILRKKEILAYITVSQDNIRDLIIIDVCNELGIRTVQLEHGALQFSRINFSEENKFLIHAFAQEYGLWSESEKQFRRKAVRYENVFGKNEDLRLRTVGNPEISYQSALENIEKYPEKRRIVFISDTDIDYFQYEADEIQSIMEWRWSIFDALKILSKRQNIEICIRYRPYCELEIREKEIPILKKWGFKISPSIPENLMEDICSSMVVMSTTSSVLSTARCLGKIVVRVEDPGMTYVKVDPQIIDVQVEDIENLSFPENLQKRQLDPNDFFNGNKLL